MKNNQFPIFNNYHSHDFDISMLKKEDIYSQIIAKNYDFMSSESISQTSSNFPDYIYEDIGQLAEDIHNDGVMFEEILQKRNNVIKTFSLDSLNKFRADIDEATFNAYNRLSEIDLAEQEAHVINDFANRAIGKIMEVPTTLYETIGQIASMDIAEYRLYANSIFYSSLETTNAYVDYLFDHSDELKIQKAKFSKNTAISPVIELGVNLPAKDDQEVDKKEKIKLLITELKDRRSHFEKQLFANEASLKSSIFKRRSIKKEIVENKRKKSYIDSMIEFNQGILFKK